MSNQLSATEENYLKAIFQVAERGNLNVSTNQIAAETETTAASVTDMIKKLSEKKLVRYEKYKGVQLTVLGDGIAKQLIRRQRLWEVFLVEKLGFSWDAVHPIAHELEHIQSNELVDRLDDFLERPKFDPHGDPIPDREGNLQYPNQLTIKELELDREAKVVGVGDSSSGFLKYLDSIHLGLGSRILVKEKVGYDGSVHLLIDGERSLQISGQAARYIYVRMDESKD